MSVTNYLLIIHQKGGLHMNEQLLDYRLTIHFLVHLMLFALYDN